mgnify:FL=1
MKKFKIKHILYRRLFRGRGLAFDGYRQYGADEDASAIDWKASLRAKHLMARQYIEERQLNFYFVVDVSRSMLFGTTDKLKAEYAAEVIIAISHLINSSGDNVGLIMFNDDFVKIIRPGRGKKQFALIVDFLSNPDLYGGGYNLDKALEFSLQGIESRFSVILLVSDFINISRNCIDKLKLLGKKFETIGLMIRDPVDEELPEGNYQMIIEDPYSNNQMIVDSSIARKRYRQNVLRQERFIRQMFDDSGIDLLKLNTSKSFVVPLVLFLRQRAEGSKRL